MPSMQNWGAGEAGSQIGYESGLGTIIERTESERILNCIKVGSSMGYGDDITQLPTEVTLPHLGNQFQLHTTQYFPFVDVPILEQIYLI